MDASVYEKLGRFYLGGRYDLASGTQLPEAVLYDSKDLTTHAVCVGMTGSGKTGLCVGLLEEAAIDGIPAIVIDPKGDLSNLLLTFPELRGEDFAPWASADEARRKGITLEEYAQWQAELWRKGLGQWGQDGERIARLKASADFAVYTPGSSAGLELSILRSFEAPEAEIVEDGDLFRERVSSTVTSLLGLVGMVADPVQSREHILLSSIMAEAWRQGDSLDLPTLIQSVLEPSMQRVGVMELETFYPSKERMGLAMKLNAVLASPSFESWTRGEPLDIGNLLYTAEGKPRVSVLSIAHLSEAERMFFVSTLLNRFVGWMRTQPGTTSLRALLYMDEIAGYCPPVANVPSKAPLLTLMKQARAFGVGVVLATQNPVDLDYKGLSNAGTWFIGRLQTERDKERVLDGLEGASQGSINRREMDRLLSALTGRVFLLHNVHEDEPVVMHTRWVMSYLRGPMTRDQIKGLMAERKAEVAAQVQLAAPAPEVVARESAQPKAEAERAPAVEVAAPVLPDWLEAYYLPVERRRENAMGVEYRAGVLGAASLRIWDRKLDIEEHRERALLAMIGSGPVGIDWDEAERVSVPAEDLDGKMPESGAHGELPSVALKKTTYTKWTRAFKAALLEGPGITLVRSPSTGEMSKPGESEREFRLSQQIVVREQRDEAVEKLRAKYAPKLATLEERLRKAEQKVDVQKGQARDAVVSSVFSTGAALLGALLGGKKLSATTVRRGGTAARGVSRSARERGDIKRAEESVEAVRERLEELEAKFERELDEAQEMPDVMHERLEQVELPPRKTGITVEHVSLVWVPFWVTGGGERIPAYSKDE